MSEEPALTVETTTSTSGVGYDSAITSALIAQDMAGGPRLEQDPDPAAWQMSGGREPGLALPGGLFGRPAPRPRAGGRTVTGPADSIQHAAAGQPGARRTRLPATQLSGNLRHPTRGP